MNVLFLHTRDVSGGGTTKAANRLRAGLQGLGINCPMLVALKESNDPRVVGPEAQRWRGKIAAFRPGLDRLPLWVYPRRLATMFHPQWLPSYGLDHVRDAAPDVISLHRITEGFLRIEDLSRLGRPLVWTLHDLWPVTGGCHFPNDCRRYEEECGRCPQLGSHREDDLSRRVWRRKARTWEKLDLTFVAPSRWMAERTAASGLLKGRPVHVIPNALDVEVFRPIDRDLARAQLKIPAEKQVLLFASPNTLGHTNKGFELLAGSLACLPADLKKDLRLVVAGPRPSGVPDTLGCAVQHLGWFTDDVALAMLYAAADATVVPSIVESFGQAAAESLACGTPVVAFDTTGLKDIVDHRRNGYLAEPFNPQDLAQGIAWILDDPARQMTLGAAGRAKAKRVFDLEIVARQYAQLFGDLIREASHTP